MDDDIGLGAFAKKGKKHDAYDGVERPPPPLADASKNVRRRNSIKEGLENCPPVNLVGNKPLKSDPIVDKAPVAPRPASRSGPTAIGAKGKTFDFMDDSQNLRSATELKAATAAERKKAAEAAPPPAAVPSPTIAAPVPVPAPPPKPSAAPEAEVVALKATLEDTKAELAKLRKGIKKLKKQHETDLAEAQRAMEGFAAAVPAADVAAMTADYEEQLCHCKNVMKTAQLNAEEVTVEAQSLRKQLDEALASGKSSKEGADELRKQLDEALASGKSSKEGADELRKQLDEALASGKSSKEGADELRKQLDEALASGKSSKEGADELRKQLDEALASGKSSKEGADELRKQLDEALASGKSSKEQADLAEERREITDKLRAELEKTQQMLADQSDELSKLREDIGHAANCPWCSGKGQVPPEKLEAEEKRVELLILAAVEKSEGDRSAALADLSAAQAALTVAEDLGKASVEKLAAVEKELADTKERLARAERSSPTPSDAPLVRPGTAAAVNRAKARAAEKKAAAAGADRGPEVQVPSEDLVNQIAMRAADAVGEGGDYSWLDDLYAIVTTYEQKCMVLQDQIDSMQVAVNIERDELAASNERIIRDLRTRIAVLEGAQQPQAPGRPSGRAPRPVPGGAFVPVPPAPRSGMVPQPPPPLGLGSSSDSPPPPGDASSGTAYPLSTIAAIPPS